MRRLDRKQQLLLALGGSIAKRRMELQMSQEDLADKAEVHRTYISDVERGLRNVSVLTLERIAIALQIPIGALFILGHAAVQTGQLPKRASKRLP